MTLIEEAWLRQIERDRRAREIGLTAWLLAQATRSLRRARNAIRLGGSWLAALRDVWRGNDALDLPDPAKFLSRGMADSHAAGYRRVGRMAGVELPDPPDLSDAYADAAGGSLDAIADTLAGKVRGRLDGAVEADSIAADLAAAAEAFEASGYTVGSSFGAERAAAAAVLPAYSDGMVHAYGLPVVADIVRGLRFVATLDEVTTDICRVRHGMKVPIGHPLLAVATPPLHFGCRSCWLPALGAFTPTPDAELPYWPPVMAGFGRPRVTVPQGVYA
jgi:hypothetical protein